MKMPTEDDMRAEFHRLKAQFEAGQEKIRPLREAYETKHAELSRLEQSELKPLADQLQAARDGLGLHEIQRQMAMLSRALGGQTGAPPAAKAKA